MKHVIEFLIAASLSVLQGAGYAMTIEQMRELPGINLLELRVADVFTECGLPHVVFDNSMAPSSEKDVRWNGIKMKLSDGDWDLIYRNSHAAIARKPANGWINPDPEKSRCFPDFSLLTLFTRGGVGILKIDKKQHKTTYTMPEDLYLAHKVIGYKVSLTTPLSFKEITMAYGRNHKTVASGKDTETLRYWVLVESGQMPVALYAVDFEINTLDKTCAGYRVASSEYDFVRRKLEAFTDAWEKYGID